MSEKDEPVLYRVSYSQRVLAELKLTISRARERGSGKEVVAAVKEIDRRLKLYPQFGQPLRDLHFRPLQTWIGVVAPLVIEYILDEDRRQVFVGLPLKQIAKSKT